MAFSLATLLGKVRGRASVDDAPDSDGAPGLGRGGGSDRGKGGKKRRRKPGPLDRLLDKLLPGRKRKAAPPPDPFDNPEILALIAAEVASLPPPETGFTPQTPRGAKPQVAPVPFGGPMIDLDPREPRAFEDTGDLMDADDLADGEVDDLGGARRPRPLRIAAAATILLALLGGAGWGLWSVIGGAGSGGEAADGALTALPRAASGARVSMALPPPPAALPAPPAATTGGDLGSERSADRRPWLAAGEPKPAEGIVPPAGQPPVPPESKPAETKPAETKPPEIKSESTGPEGRPAGGEAAAQLAAMPTLRLSAPLPPLADPARPPPGENAGMPTFAALAPPPPPDQVKALGPAPLPDLSRATPQGVLPVVAADGRTAWRAYGRPYDGPPGRPRAAVVIVGLGLDAQATEAAITRLPPTVTLSFSPYAPDLAAQVARARQHGHEVTLDLPMDAGDGSRDPGPLGLRPDMPPTEALARLATLMTRATGYVGLVGGRDGKPLDAADGPLAAVLADLGQRGLVYLDGAAAGNGALSAGGRGAPAARVVVRLDDRPFRAAIDSRLDYLAQAAKARGLAVGILHPLPVSFERLERWLRDLEAHGVVLAPLSAAMPPPGT